MDVLEPADPPKGFSWRQPPFVFTLIGLTGHLPLHEFAHLLVVWLSACWSMV
jgi:hypothetical protein